LSELSFRITKRFDTPSSLMTGGGEDSSPASDCASAVIMFSWFSVRKKGSLMKSQA
jgi:hypothetical protein